MAGPAKLIGVYARVAGVWQRINGGVPEAFSGPQVKSGAWHNCDWVKAMASSTWQVTWANINGELSMPTVILAEDFDISPYNVAAYVHYNANGSIDRKHNGTIYNNYSSWRDYDNGRDIQYHVLEDTNYNGANVNQQPTKGQWLDFTSTLIFDCSKSGSGFLFYDDGWAVYTRDKVRADPLGSVPRGDVDISLEAEV